MSAYEVIDKLVAAIHEDNYDFIMVNYANGDMVGHKGIYKLKPKAVKAIDRWVHNTLKAAGATGYQVIIIAYHCNVSILSYWLYLSTQPIRWIKCPSSMSLTILNSLSTLNAWPISLPASFTSWGCLNPGRWSSTISSMSPNDASQLRQELLLLNSKFLKYFHFRNLLFI